MFSDFNFFTFFFHYFFFFLFAISGGGSGSGSGGGSGSGSGSGSGGANESNNAVIASSTTSTTLDEDWPYDDLRMPPASPVLSVHKKGPLTIPSYTVLSSLLDRVVYHTKRILHGLNKKERYAYLHHQAITDATPFMSHAAALHRLNKKGLVDEVSTGNYRVASALTPEEEILM